MRYKAFTDDAPLDRQPCRFPWNPEITFNIWRSGRRAFAERKTKLQTAVAPRLLSHVAKKRGMTVAELDAKAVDLEEAFKELSVDEAIETFGPEVVGLGAELDIEGIALYLVESVDGPLILADTSDKVLGWHDRDGKDTPHCGVAFLREMPDEIPEWILGEADRIEAEFQAFMEAASGNSLTSSADSAEEPEGEPS